ncbi:MAG: hypothetical protein GF409_02550 [Candidatus Omnitrophica bacterium]|nr:hypothetical protein [Candidatus Omnitrophota bacterium]
MTKYGFAREFISGLSLIKKIREIDKLGELPADLPGKKAAIEDYIADIRRARADLLEMRTALAPYENSSDEQVRKASVLALKSYDSYIRALSDILREQSLIWQIRLTGQEMARVIGRIRDEYPRIDMAMKILRDSSMLVSLAMLEAEADQAGKLTYLGITSEQRRELINYLEKIYGKDLSGDIRESDPVIYQCGAILLKGLTGIHLSSDEREHVN